MSEINLTNELARAASAYLRSAAHQPVQWRQWTERAFEEARQQGKPILLDIGAVWCHWCHVMDRESYENPDVARLINENYIPVKVDRDERPDIDARYQMAVSALTGQGGWPLTAFLTPEGQPFYGGTYFPPDDVGGRPGMKRVLESIAHNYKTHQADIFSSADKISAALSGHEKFERSGGKAGRQVVEAILQNISRMFDPQHGGFGSAPKFPHPSAIDLVLDQYLETRQTWLSTIVTTTLERMGRGGVYDQLGGGFHRYSVDQRWIVPHFEKMSYDNAGLLVNYLHGYQLTGNELFREIALGVLSFIEQVLSSPDGGFYASQDADYSLEDDGDYFTWTLDELKGVLEGREADVAAQYYHIEPTGEMHHNPAKNVLFIDQPIEAIAWRTHLDRAEVKKILERAQAKMLEGRSKRPTPFVDTTLYSSWNGMMISALLEAYKVLGVEGERDRALLTLDLLLAKCYDPAKGMYHSFAHGRAEIEGLLDDQVFMTAALLDAYEVTGTRSYFDRAVELMETTIRRFWDEKDAGFFDTAKDLDSRYGSLKITRKAFQDSPTPAGNSIAALVLDRLAVLADRSDFREKAGATLDVFAAKAAEYGLFAASYGLALINHLRAPTEIVVVGASDDERTKKLREAAYRAPLAGKRVLTFAPEQLKARDLPAGLAATLPHMPLDGRPLALFCTGTTCRAPAETPEALAETINLKPA